MAASFFDDFLTSSDTLRVYQGNKLTFASTADRLLPLLEYASKFSPYPEGVTIFDKIVGNAAALLAIRINSGEVRSPLGSRLAAETLDRYGIKYRFSQIVPFIMRPDGEAMCPMEELSIGKSPEEFYQAVKKLAWGSGEQGYARKEKAMTKEIISVPNAPALPFSPGVKAGQYLFVSGQVGFKDPETGEKVIGIKAQTRGCLEKVRAVLESALLSLDDVVKVTVILKNAADFAGMNEVYQSYFPKDQPARTAIIADLAYPDILVEIECIAYCP